MGWISFEHRFSVGYNIWGMGSCHGQHQFVDKCKSIVWKEHANNDKLLKLMTCGQQTNQIAYEYKKAYRCSDSYKYDEE